MRQGHSLGGALLRPVRWQWHMNIYLDDYNMLSHCHAYFSPFMCGKTACVVEQLEAADFFSASIPKSRLFITVHDAVLYIRKKQWKAYFVLVGHHQYLSHFWLLCLFITCHRRNTFFEIFSHIELWIFQFLSGCVPQHPDVTSRGQIHSNLALFLLLFSGCFLFHHSPSSPPLSVKGEWTTLTWRPVAMET